MQQNVLMLLNYVYVFKILDMHTSYMHIRIVNVNHDSI